MERAQVLGEYVGMSIGRRRGSYGLIPAGEPIPDVTVRRAAESFSISLMLRFSFVSKICFGEIWSKRYSTYFVYCKLAVLPWCRVENIPDSFHYLKKKHFPLYKC